MTTTIPAINRHGQPQSGAEQPLSIQVTDGGALVVQMHTLLRQMTPVLEQPESVPESYRQQLAEQAKTLLAGIPDESLCEDEEYEPGCWAEETERAMEEPY